MLHVIWSCHDEWWITAQKKFSIKDFFSKCDHIRSFLRIWPHLLKKSIMENFIFSQGIMNDAVIQSSELVNSLNQPIFSIFRSSFLNISFLSANFIKVSGNPCDDHSLTSIIWKKIFLQLFLYFSAQIEIESYKLIYESQFRHFIKWGKIFITFGTFYD